MIGFGKVTILENKDWKPSPDADAWWLFWIEHLRPAAIARDAYVAADAAERELPDRGGQMMLEVSCVIYTSLTFLVGAVVIDAATHVVSMRCAVRARSARTEK